MNVGALKSFLRVSWYNCEMNAEKYNAAHEDCLKCASAEEVIICMCLCE